MNSMNDTGSFAKVSSTNSAGSFATINCSGAIEIQPAREHVKKQAATIGVLLMNTGTPDEPSEEAIRRYLAEFMSDTMLFSAPPIIWKQVLKHKILPNRPKVTLPKYQRLWTDDGFPFVLTSQKQARMLERVLNQQAESTASAETAEQIAFSTPTQAISDSAAQITLDVPAQTIESKSPTYHVRLAMRYGNPSILSQLDELQKLHCEEVVLLPLYPQEVISCTRTCLAECHRMLEKLQLETGWDPQVTEVRSFYNLPSYRKALSDSICRAWTPSENSALVMSFHSTLVSHVVNGGDPYALQTIETRSNLEDDLNLERFSIELGYHSQMNKKKWIGPFTEDILEELATKGVTDVCVVCPGFVTDCMETTLDIDEEKRNAFLQHAPKGSVFTYVPCLNDDPALIETLADAIARAHG